MSHKYKHIHFIGIAGSAIAPIAVMMAQKGFKVTGSDENVYEPALSLLNKNGIQWHEGADIDIIKKADLIILGGGVMMKGLEHPEFVEAKRRGKQIEGYAFIVQEFLIKEESIVVTGSYGKSTTTPLIAWILEKAGFDPSLMVGGKPIDYDSGVFSRNGKYSVVEGDEYVSVFGFDMEPRFIHYKPKYTIISSLEWDHINVYPTEESYIEAFYKLGDLVKKAKGKIFLSANGKNNDKVYKKYNELVITYGLDDLENTINQKPNYIASEIKFNEDFTSFNIYHDSVLLGQLKTPMIGKHNVDNCLAATALAHFLGIEFEIIAKAVETYHGLKRRQEIRGKTDNGAVVIEDFAHSPVKIKSTISAIKTRYRDKKLVCIYLPRLSQAEDRRTLDGYKGAFNGADLVIIPKILVKKSTPKENRIYGKDMIIAIASEKSPAQYMPVDDQIERYIKKECDENTVVAFISASGWNGLIEKVLEKL